MILCNLHIRKDRILLEERRDTIHLFDNHRIGIIGTREPLGTDPTGWESAVSDSLLDIQVGVECGAGLCAACRVPA